MKQMALVPLLALLFTGCITEKVDWQARIGNYTQDQAISDLGPPVTSAKLSDGSVADDWITQHRHVIVAPEPYFLPPGAYFGPPTPGYTETEIPDHYLQLTFGRDGKLKAWKQFAR